MINQWFKFYGSEYLSDPKMLALSACQRSCWITLLCYASVSEIPGVVKYLNEDQLIIQSGIDLADDEFKQTKGVLEHFKELSMITLDNGMITLLNWNKRQERSLTPYERVKKYRERKRDDNTDNEVITQVITTEEKREEKNRKEKRILPLASVSYLTKIPGEDIKEFRARFNASEKQIRSKGEDLKLYCERKGRVYKNYKSFLLNALKRDFPERPPESPPPTPQVEQPLSEDQKKNIETIKSETKKIVEKLKVKTS